MLTLDYLRSFDFAKVIFSFYFIGFILDNPLWMSKIFDRVFLRSWNIIWLLLFYFEDFIEKLFIFLLDIWYFPYSFYEIPKQAWLFMCICGDILLKRYFWDLLLAFLVLSLFSYPIFYIFMINFQEAFVLSLFVLIIFFLSSALFMLISVP